MQRAVGTHHVVIARIPMIDFRLLLTACDGVDNGLLASGLTRIDIGQLRAQRTHVAIVGNRQIHGIPAAMHTAELMHVEQHGTAGNVRRGNGEAMHVRSGNLRARLDRIAVDDSAWIRADATDGAI